jgi:hypothetical protein
MPFLPVPKGRQRFSVCLLCGGAEGRERNVFSEDFKPLHCLLKSITLGGTTKDNFTEGPSQDLQGLIKNLCLN